MMMGFRFHFLFSQLLVWLCFLSISSVNCQDRRKNVLVFIADDGGFLQTIYNNSVCDTPSLDRLASRSIVFKNGYTSVSSCSPSRSVLLSGLPQHQNGMYGLHHSFHHFESFDGVKSLPVILKKHGVRTGLIGKKHIGPDDVYKFDYERSSKQGYNLDQIGRNMTFMRQFVHEFLNEKDDRPFFLYIGFFDTHRGNPSKTGQFGPFMDKWGSRQPGMGDIPDWKPHFYDPSKVIVPYFLPDTPATRSELASMYTSFNRMDQGIGMFLSELEKAGHADDTLVLFTSDNGIPFPDAKTNLYEPGNGVPMMMSSPLHKESWGKVSEAKTNTLDFVPTILDWLKVPYPSHKLFGHKVQLSGHSLLSLIDSRPLDASYNFSVTYSSHNLHEVTMYYPMRVARSGQYRLIHNLNHGAPYPIALDIYLSSTFQDLLNRSSRGEATHWFKTLDQYYYRPEWELFDLTKDPQELRNLAYNEGYRKEFDWLKSKMVAWQWETSDPWVCLPHHELYDNRCMNLYNEKTKMEL